MPPDTPLLAALICTRNRGSNLTATVASVLANAYPNFEVVVIDQSTSDDTARAIAPFLTDPRLRYRRTDTVGVSRARNLGLTETQAALVAITDDDCEVPPDWLAVMAAAFSDPRVVLAFCTVDAAPHDAAAGFIPGYERTGTALITGPLGKCKARGIGAGMAVRREAILALGGFDEMLGPGATFPACEEGDLAVRVLLRGHAVYETDAVAVCHAGFRTWAEGRELSVRDWAGIGAAYSKPLKCGHWRFAVVPLYEFVRYALWPPLADLLRGRTPRGAGRILAFGQGFRRGLQTPVNCQTLLFRPPEQQPLG